MLSKVSCKVRTFCSYVSCFVRPHVDNRLDGGRGVASSQDWTFCQLQRPSRSKGTHLRFKSSGISSSLRSCIMPKSCLRAWRPTEVLMGKLGCSDRCTTWPGLTWPPREPACQLLTGRSWWSASGGWWWSTRSGCPTTPPPPSTSGRPWLGRNQPSESLLLVKQGCSCCSAQWDRTTRLGSSQSTCWPTLSTCEPGLEVVASPRWAPTMPPHCGHRYLQCILGFNERNHVLAEDCWATRVPSVPLALWGRSWNHRGNHGSDILYMSGSFRLWVKLNVWTRLPGGSYEPFHPPGAPWRFQGAGDPSPEHRCYSAWRHQVCPKTWTTAHLLCIFVNGSINSPLPWRLIWLKHHLIWPSIIHNFIFNFHACKSLKQKSTRIGGTFDLFVNLKRICQCNLNPW